MNEAGVAGTGTQSGFLGWIERTGNKLPDPVFIFFWLIAAVIVVSVIASLTGYSALHPTQVDEAGGLGTDFQSNGTRCAAKATVPTPAQRCVQTGARFSMKASMPSAASAFIMSHAMTVPA